MSEHTEPTEAQASPPDSLAVTPLTRRKESGPERPNLPADIEEQFNALMQSVQVLSAHFLGESGSPAATESLKERSARRIKKFQRAAGDERTAASTDEETPVPGPEGGSAAQTATADETSDSLALNKHIAWPRLGIQEGLPPVPPPAAPRRWWQRRPTLGVFVGAQVVGLILLAVGFLIGHATSPARASNNGKRPGHTDMDLFGQPELTEQALQTANTGLHAEHAGDPESARKTYETAITKHVNLAGMNYRLALLAVQRNDRLEAEQRLERSITDGESVAECCYILARLAADKGDFEEASNQMQRATRVQPFTGKYFFYWGECLRREGKPQAAVAAIEQALDRPYTAEDGDIYLFKQRLAKVEYGHDEAFNAEFASHLKQPPVGGEWLLLAAAQDFEHQAYASAGERLKQATDRLPSALYSAAIHDYLFQAQAKRSEVTALLNRPVLVPISQAGPTVLDPGSWVAQRADPATWPSASGQTTQ